MRLTAGSYRTKIIIVRTAVSAVAKTLVFTVFVPGTVAGYVPWRLRQNAAPVTGAEGWAAIIVIPLRVSIYLHTPFWGPPLPRRPTPPPLPPPQTPPPQPLHPF